MTGFVVLVKLKTIKCLQMNMGKSLNNNGNGWNNNIHTSFYIHSMLCLIIHGIIEIDDRMVNVATNKYQIVIRINGRI